MVSETLKPLILMTPPMVFKVFLACRRSPLEVDSASQKSSKIGLKSHKSCKRTFRGRLEKYIIVGSFVLMNKSSERLPFWEPKSQTKAYTTGHLFGRLREGPGTSFLDDFRSFVGWLFDYF